MAGSPAYSTNAPTKPQPSSPPPPGSYYAWNPTTQQWDTLQGEPRAGLDIISPEAAKGAISGAITGAMAGGPVGAVLGGVAGGASGAYQAGQAEKASGMGGTYTPADGSGAAPGTAGGAGSIDADSREIYRRALANSERAYSAGTIDSRDVVDPGIAPSQRVTAAGAAPVVNYSAAKIAGAERVAAPELGGAAQVERPQGIDPALATASDPNAVTIDQSRSDNVRSLQMDNLEALQREAAGNGVGAQAARARLNSALARVNNDTFAAAGAARGAGRTGLQREAMLQGSRNALEAALKGEELGLQQQLGAQQQLTGALQGTRGQDVDVATSQAQIDAQRENLQAQLRTATAQGNAQEINRIRTAMAQLDQQAQQFNAGATNQRTEVQGQMGLDAATGNANRQLSVDTTNTGAENDSRRINTGAVNTSNLDAAGRTDTVAMNNAGRYDTRAIAAGGQNVDVQTGNADRGLRADTAQEDANRGAFNSTTDAAATGISGANQAVGNRVDLINPTTNAKKESDAASARDREFWLDAATGAATAINQRKPPATTAATTNPDGLLTPKFAAKGGIAAEPTIAGEAGPELVIPIKKPSAGLEAALHPDGQPAGSKKLDLESELGRRLISRVFSDDDDDMSDMLFAAALRRRKVA